MIDDIEQIRPDDKLVIVRIRASDWEALTGAGMPLPTPARIQLVEQPGQTAGGIDGITTYGVRLVSSS